MENSFSPSFAQDIWDIVQEYIPKKKKRVLSEQLVQLFEYYGCENLEEAEDLYYTARPDELEKEDNFDEDDEFGDD